MTDDQTQSFDDAESAATPESVQPETDRDLPGEVLANARHRPADDFVVDDPEAEELTTPDTPDAGTAIDDPDQLEQADKVARSARSSRPVRRKAPLPPVEDEPTPADEVAETAPAPGASLRPKRRSPQASGSSGSTALAVAEDAAAPSTTKVRGRKSRAARREVTTLDPDHRVGPAEFTRQSVDELRKVIWPTGDQLMQYFVVVLGFVLFIIAFVGLLDLFFGWSLLKLLGK